MKAKEYVSKYYSELTLTTDRDKLYDACTECFAEFNKETNALIKTVNSTNAKLAKIRECEKKWIAIGAALEKHLLSTQIGPEKLTEIPAEHENYIDKMDLEITTRLWHRYMHAYHPDILKLIHSVPTSILVQRSINLPR